MSKPTTLLWLDLETTGLDTKRDYVIECSVFMTDANGDDPRNHRTWVIKPTNKFWSSQMNDFVRDMHTNSGLLQEVEEVGISQPEFELDFQLYLNTYRPKDGEKYTLTGSGVGPFDRIILKQQFSWIEDFLNYYVLDVGVIGRFIRHCCGMEGEWGERQSVKHRAADDIKDHYEEFLFYRDWVSMR